MGLQPGSISPNSVSLLFYFILLFSLLYLKHLQLSLYMGAGEVGDIRCCRWCWALDCMRRLLLSVARGKDSTWEIGFLYPGLP